MLNMAQRSDQAALRDFADGGRAREACRGNPQSQHFSAFCQVSGSVKYRIAPSILQREREFQCKE
jgi:hypothetical protein